MRRAWTLAAWGFFALSLLDVLFVFIVSQFGPYGGPIPFVSPSLLIGVGCGAAGVGLLIALVARRRHAAGRTPALANGGLLGLLVLMAPLFAFMAFAAAWPLPTLVVQIHAVPARPTSGRLDVLLVTEAGTQVNATLAFDTSATPSFLTYAHLKGSGTLTLSVHTSDGLDAQHSWSWPNCNGYGVLLKPSAIEFDGPICGD